MLCSLLPHFSCLLFNITLISGSIRTAISSVHNDLYSILYYNYCRVSANLFKFRTERISNITDWSPLLMAASREPYDNKGYELKRERVCIP